MLLRAVLLGAAVNLLGLTSLAIAGPSNDDFFPTALTCASGHTVVYEERSIKGYCRKWRLRFTRNDVVSADVFKPDKDCTTPLTIFHIRETDIDPVQRSARRDLFKLLGNLDRVCFGNLALRDEYSSFLAENRREVASGNMDESRVDPSMGLSLKSGNDR